MSVKAVPVPAGATADEWSDDEPNPYRVIWGSTHPVSVGRPSNEGLTEVRVYTHAVQKADGDLSCDAGDAPGVSIDTIHADDDGVARDSGVTVSAVEARQLAAALNAAAEELDRWRGSVDQLVDSPSCDGLSEVVVNRGDIPHGCLSDVIVVVDEPGDRFEVLCQPFEPNDDPQYDGD
ncbi:MAG: hypothetical protein AB7E41_21500, partial [Mycolicibacterium sp.]